MTGQHDGKIRMKGSK